MKHITASVAQFVRTKSTPGIMPTVMMTIVMMTIVMLAINRFETFFLLTPLMFS